MSNRIDIRIQYENDEELYTSLMLVYEKRGFRRYESITSRAKVGFEKVVPLKLVEPRIETVDGIEVMIFPSSM